MIVGPRPDRRVRQGLVVVLSLALAIRLGTSGYPLWFDEVASTVFAARPWHQLWGDWMLRETNPPLFYSLLKVWTGIVGHGDAALRVLPMILGMAGVFFGWRLGRRIGGERAGLVVALVLALSAAHVEYSQGLRGYGMAHSATLAACLSMAAFVDRGQRRDLIGYAAAMLVALYAHSVMLVFLLLANVAALLLLWRYPRRLAEWMAGNLAVLAGYGWWGWITWRQMGHATSNIGWIARPDLAEAIRVTVQAYLPFHVLVPGALVGASLLVIGAAAIAASWREGELRAKLLLGVVAAGAPVAMFAISQFVPILIPRTLWWASGPATVLLVVSVMTLKMRLLRAIGVGALLLFAAMDLVNWLPQRQHEAWGEALRAIAKQAPGATVLVQGDAVALAAMRYRPEGVRLMTVPDRAEVGDRWASGLAELPSADLTLLPDRLYTLRRANSDAGRALNGYRAREWPEATDGRQPFVTRWTRVQAAD